MNSGFLLFEVRRVVRARKFWIMAFLFPTLMYLIQANLFSGLFEGRGGVDFREHLMGNLAAFGAFFVALNVGTRVAIERSTGWQRQLRITPLSAPSYLVAKLSAAMVVALPAIAAVAVVGALVEGVRLPVGGWLYLVLGIWAGTLPFALLGVFIGQIATAESVQLLTSMSHMLLGILGGALFPSVAFPGWMQAVSTVLPSRWLAEIGHAAVGEAANGPVAAVVLAGWTVVLGGAVVLRYVRDSARV
ncbi:ABC transporter permease [Saccharothrix variisporea]|uniref:ABC-2 type transport system permease protein n=1 Tax=Saccharothrix variisporea TaxID=543527 RepID=A0A495XAQ4_9PSEU|nr:ABC transporter permease [Saccharothrix variisporea]RKT70175.1 ABC-2 type transport system permease protein [Saccharothrix variisporea]